MDAAATEHLINALAAQRNEAHDRHAQCLAQLNYLMAQKVAREQELQGKIDELAAELDLAQGAI